MALTRLSGSTTVTVANVSYFTVLTPSMGVVMDGSHKTQAALPTSGSLALSPGQLVKLTTGSPATTGARKLDVCDAASTPYGFAYGSKLLKYAPTDYYFDPDTYVTVASGHGEVLISADAFEGGSIPNTGSSVYPANGGLLKTSGTTAIGHVEAADDTVRLPGATSNISGTAVARVRFHIPGF